VVADDNPDVRFALRFQLEADEIEVVGEAADGAEAAEQCAAEHPDVIVIDLDMPVLDGAKAIEAIREDAHAPKVIVLAEAEGSALWQAAEAQRPDAMLTKPRAIAQLPEVVRAVCDTD
jgi:DNA-binding NarL/FixJ family response regulator